MSEENGTSRVKTAPEPKSEAPNPAKTTLLLVPEHLAQRLIENLQNQKHRKVHGLITALTSCPRTQL